MVGLALHGGERAVTLLHDRLGSLPHPLRGHDLGVEQRNGFVDVEHRAAFVGLDAFKRLLAGRAVVVSQVTGGSLATQPSECPHVYVSVALASSALVASSTPSATTRSGVAVAWRSCCSSRSATASADCHSPSSRTWSCTVDRSLGCTSPPRAWAPAACAGTSAARPPIAPAIACSAPRTAAQDVRRSAIAPSSSARRAAAVGPSRASRNSAARRTGSRIWYRSTFRGPAEPHDCWSTIMNGKITSM